MSEPQPSPPDKKRSYFWPIAVNLGLLLLEALASGGNADSLAFSVVALAIINGVAAVIMGRAGRMHYVVAFILSVLILLLIGLGVCALILQNGLHGEH